MDEPRANRHQFALWKFFLITLVFAILAVIPRLTSGVSIPLSSVFWVVAIHKCCLATLGAYTMWLLLGKKRAWSFALTVTLIAVCGPDLVLASEVSVTGSTDRTMALLDVVGGADLFERTHSYLYELFGFDFDD